MSFALPLPAPVARPPRARRALALSLAPSLALLLALTGLGAQAQSTPSEPPLRLEPVVITATRTPLPVTHVLADTTVITRDELDRSPSQDLVDVLQRAGGLQLSRNGGLGATSSMFLRGAEARHTALLVDGVRIDSQATGGASWEAIPLDQIERIEIVRGPASAVYGSDAIAGVVQVFTRKGQPGAPRWSLGAGLGTQGTRKLDAGVSGAGEVFDLAVTGAHERTRGFNAMTDPDKFGFVADRDGARQSSASARLGARLGADHRVEASALSSRLNAQYDGRNPFNLPPDPVDQDDHSRRGLDTLGATWHASWHPAWRSSLQLGQSTDRYATEPTPYRTRTRLRTVAWQHDLDHGPHHLQATLERRQDALVNPSLDGFSTPIDADRHQHSLALAYGWREATGPTVQAMLRHDRDSEFGGQTTGSLGFGVPLAPGWRAHATAATGFRAPTLYQRFSEYGQAGLRPETSRNLEFGLSRQGEGHAWKATLYRNRVSQLIGFVDELGGTGVCASDFGCYDNIAQTATLQGLALSGQLSWAGVAWGGKLDLLSARNGQTGQTLARRSRRIANLSADTDWAQWRLGAQWHLEGARWDDAANTQRVGGYGSLGVSAQRPIAPDWTLQLRGDNLGNRRYEQIRGYGVPPRSAYVGVRWATRP